MSSPPPARPRFAPGNRPRGNWSFKGFVVKSAWIGAIVFAVFYLMNTKKEPQVTAQAPPPRESFENVELTTAASMQRQQLTTAKFKQRQLIATYGEVTRALDEWEKELDVWEKAGPPLAKAHEGKKLATDTTLVKRYRVVMSQERPTREELTTARSLADDLVSPVREAVNNSDDASIPSEELATNLRELRTKAKKARDELRSAREQIEALIAQAGDASGDETLEAAIRRQVHQEANERTALIDAAVKKAEDEGNRRVAEEKATSTRLALELQATKLKQEQEAARKQQMAAMRQAQLAAEAAATEREAQEIGTSAWVRSLFPPGFNLGGRKLSGYDFSNKVGTSFGSGGGGVRDERQATLQDHYGKARTLYDAYLLQRRFSLKLDDREQ